MDHRDECAGLDSRQLPDAYLLPYPVESPSTPIPVTPPLATIGRSSRNTIIIDAATISRRHAVMTADAGNYTVKDLNSRNGTFINGKKVTSGRVRHHDRIGFGRQTFLFLKRAAEKGPQETLLDTTSAIDWRQDEIEPNDFIACAAEEAVLGLLSSKKRATPPSDQTVNRFEEAHQRLSLLYGLSEDLRSARNIKDILTDGLDLILEAIVAAERAVIMLRSDPDKGLEVAASRHRTSIAHPSGIQISRTLLDWVLTKKVALVSQNGADDGRLKDSESIRMNHSNAIICVPIIVRETVIGVLYVDSKHPFAHLTHEDAAFTAAVAHELALTIDNIRLQKAAIRNERMAAIGLTVSNLAHNIKNLTMLNQNAIDLMQINLDRLGDAQTDACWKIIEESLKRINNLSVEMLAYASDQELVPTLTDINQVIVGQADIFAQHKKNRAPRFSFELSPDNPRWMIDAQQFQRALLNIVVNAIDAVECRLDGHICIATTVEENRHLVVTVKDNGCGIAADKQEKIYDLFYTTKGTRGSGLGLPMVKKFIAASGGKLEVATEKGVGTTVKMIFASPKGERVGGQ